MLFKQKHLGGIKSGKLRLAFRCWRRPTVKTGGTLKTAVGVVAIDAVERARLEDLTAKDAKLAGYASLDELLREIRSREGTLYRIELHFQGADPRIELREQKTLSKSELEEVLQRLGRMDARSKNGPWTRQVLELLHANPGVRAGDLAPQLEREKLAFKRDVRKLKELGLTESLGTGYRLSPRGNSVLKALKRQ
jgi:hypothetical protein